MLRDQTIPDKKLYWTTVKILFTKEEAKLIRQAACRWEPLDDNFCKGKRAADGVIVSFLGWELCELAGAVNMEASAVEDWGCAKNLKDILEQKILPVKRSWLKQ